MSSDTLRHRIAAQLDPELRRGTGLSGLNKCLVAFILIAAAAAILETEPLVSAGHEVAFRMFELGIGLIFLLEYSMRVWLAPLNPRYASARWPRLRFASSFSAIVDLLSVIPVIAALGGGGTLVLRFFRVLRIIRLAKLGRMSRAWNDLLDALKSRRHELLLTLGIAIVIMLISSTLMYWAEADAQPDKFGSIPRSFWWAVVTLTTVGYGDVFPITPLGKALSGVVAVAGIGLIAMPAGILAAAFSDAVQRRKSDSLTV